jgi:hypothetical protein
MLETEVWTPSVNARNGGWSSGNFLKAKQGYTVRKNGKRQMDIVYIDKFQYEIQEQKEVPVRYTAIYRPISSTTINRINNKPDWMIRVAYMYSLV